MKKELAEKVNIIVKNSGKDAFPINNSNDGNSEKNAQAASFSAKDVLEELKASVSAADYAHNTGHFPESGITDNGGYNIADPETHFSLGYFYERGLGTEKDPVKAVLHYRFSAMSGFPFALRNLQSMADRGVTDALPVLLNCYQRVPVPDGKKVMSLFLKTAGMHGLAVSGKLAYVLEKIFSGFKDTDIQQLSEKLDSLTAEDINTYNTVFSPSVIMLHMPTDFRRMRMESGLDSVYISGGWGFSREDAIIVNPAKARGQDTDSDDEILIDDILFDIMDCIAFYNGTQAGLPEPAGWKISQEILPPDSKSGTGRISSGSLVRAVHEISGLPAIVLAAIDKSAAQGKGLTKEKIALFDKISHRLTVNFNIERYIRFE